MSDNSLLAWAIGVLATLGAAAIGHLYKLQGITRERIEQASAGQLGEIRVAINQLRQEIDKDRHERTENRVEMAKSIASMVTREDLSKQTSWMLVELDRRAWPQQRGSD